MAYTLLIYKALCNKVLFGGVDWVIDDYQKGIPLAQAIYAKLHIAHEISFDEFEIVADSSGDDDFELISSFLEFDNVIRFITAFGFKMDKEKKQFSWNCKKKQQNKNSKENKENRENKDNKSDNKQQEYIKYINIDNNEQEKEKEKKRNKKNNESRGLMRQTVGQVLKEYIGRLGITIPANNIPRNMTGLRRIVTHLCIFLILLAFFYFLCFVLFCFVAIM